jgi:hypothetical protein
MEVVIAMLEPRRLFFQIALGLTCTLTALAQDVSRDALRKEIQAKRGELAALEKEFLAPAETDRAQFGSLLSQPNTGLIRLLPREKFDGDVAKNEKTLTMRGGGAYYSFARATHEYGYGSDIGLYSGYLSVGFAGVDYGMLLKLGDISVEDVSPELPAVHTLLEYTAATNEPDARIEQRRVSTGVDFSGFVFKNRLPLETDTTYLLRSISYEKSDIAVTFRIVRKDTDGSAIIVFKVLKNFSVPKLARN